MVQLQKARSTKDHTPSANDAFIGFTSSVHFDQRLWMFDLAGSIAHARTLAAAGLLTGTELSKMTKALKQVAARFANGTVTLAPELEDIHMNIEKMLCDEVGDLGAKLHTGRSRNDQVALDVRLAVREMLAQAIASTTDLQSVLLKRARENASIVMPGFTHMQHAQPVLLSHHLMAHFWRLQRDADRLEGCYTRANVSPLGSGALAGTGFDLDRSVAADLLGMSSITENSLDAVSDRDFVAESLFGLSLLMVHLSSLSEEIVNWSSKEFGFVRIPKSVGGGSSMMPQKLNPDIAELVRGKSGRTIGDLVAILTLLKSLPLAYNRDLQEDKESLFDAFDTAEASTCALTTLLAEIEFNEVGMRKSAEIGLMTATDLADFLTKEGVPFRKAHAEVKKMAYEAEGDDQKFLALADALLSRHARSAIAPGYLSAESIVARRKVPGGTAPDSVAKQMRSGLAVLAKNKKTMSAMKKQTRRVELLLTA